LSLIVNVWTLCVNTDFSLIIMSVAWTLLDRCAPTGRNYVGRIRHVLSVRRRAPFPRNLIHGCNLFPGGNKLPTFSRLTLSSGTEFANSDRPPTDSGAPLANCRSAMADSGSPLASSRQPLANSVGRFAKSRRTLADCGWNMGDSGRPLAKSGRALAEAGWESVRAATDAASGGTEITGWESGWISIG